MCILGVKCMKIAILSNVNCDFIARLLSAKYDVCPTEGYGNIWGKLLNPSSKLNEYAPQLLLFIVDINELLRNEEDYSDKCRLIDDWFNRLVNVYSKKKEYFISDFRYNNEINDNDEFDADKVSNYWINKLSEAVNSNSNIHRLGLQRMADKLGEVFWDRKMWYMGKIPFSHKGNVAIADFIKNILEIYTRKVQKKLLILDLDNTLWGGIIGEDGVDGIQLSDDHEGAIFKDIQRLIIKMKYRGVILAVCSKNNLSDVKKVWDNNPHIILKKNDFVSCKINWQNKALNIKEIVEELNIGLDSVVFIDDIPHERDNIKEQLPMVTVPDYPKIIDDLPAFYRDVFDKYFKKIKTTEEDINKTTQYILNKKRNDESIHMDFSQFIKGLDISVQRVKLSEQVIVRVVQLINKTNQFNLTTRRYDRAQLENMMTSGYEIYAYNVIDKYGDYGIVAVIIIDTKESRIDTFLMSCRIMGKLIENFLLTEIEQIMISRGKNEILGEFIPTNKNMPVKEFYLGNGYTLEGIV